MQAVARSSRSGALVIIVMALGLHLWMLDAGVHPSHLPLPSGIGMSAHTSSGPAPLPPCSTGMSACVVDAPDDLASLLNGLLVAVGALALLGALVRIGATARPTSATPDGRSPPHDVPASVVLLE